MELFTMTENHRMMEHTLLAPKSMSLVMKDI